MMNIEYIVYHNGSFKPESEVHISFRDLGFQRAYGVFDYMRTYRQEVFQLRWHAAKLMSSLEKMNISVNLDEHKFFEIIHELFILNKKKIKTDPLVEYGIKTIITGGIEGTPTLLIYLESLDTSFYSEKQKTGVSLLVKKNPRQLASAKHLDYKTLFSENKELQKNNCLEILHADDKFVYESGTSNIFIIKNNTIITPKEGIYQGSTREFLLDILKTKFDIKEQAITWDKFFDADEVFIAASKKEVLPVTTVYFDSQKYTFSQGENIQVIIKLFNENKYNKKYYF